MADQEMMSNAAAFPPLAADWRATSVSEDEREAVTNYLEDVNQLMARAQESLPTVNTDKEKEQHALVEMQRLALENYTTRLLSMRQILTYVRENSDWQTATIKRDMLATLDLLDFEFSSVESTENALAQLGLEKGKPYYGNLQIIFRKYFSELFALLEDFTDEKLENRAYSLISYIDQLRELFETMLENDGDFPSFVQHILPYPRPGL